MDDGAEAGISRSRIQEGTNKPKVVIKIRKEELKRSRAGACQHNPDPLSHPNGARWWLVSLRAHDHAYSGR